MRFFRLFWIPEGATAAGGAYVRDNWEDLIRILALESVRNKVLVVGEDLGTVEPEVRERLDALRHPQLPPVLFRTRAGGEFKRASEYPAQALVSSTTHDLPTIAGFWVNADIEARRQAGVVDEAGYHAPDPGPHGGKAEDARRATFVRLAAGLRAASGRPNPGAHRRAAQRGDRLPGIDAFHAHGGEPGGPDQGNRAAEPARHHGAVSATGAGR